MFNAQSVRAFFQSEVNRMENIAQLVEMHERARKARVNSLRNQKPMKRSWFSKGPLGRQVPVVELAECVMCSAACHKDELLCSQCEALIQPLDIKQLHQGSLILVADESGAWWTSVSRVYEKTVMTTYRMLVEKSRILQVR
jgi:hypothetical protein